MGKIDETRHQKTQDEVAAEEIRRRCGSDLEAWDKYLKKAVEVPLREILCDEDDTIDNCSIGYNDVAPESFPPKKAPHAVQFVRELMGALTIREREVIQAFFWSEESERHIAKRLKITRGSVRHYRDRALKKLGQMAIAKALSVKSFEEVTT